MPTPAPTVACAVRIVSAYVARNSLPAAGLPDLLSGIHRALAALTPSQAVPVERPTAAQIRDSVRPDAIVSFEDGRAYKVLRRHLTLRGLTPEAYRAKWGLPPAYPMVCADYSTRRSEISRQIERGQRLPTRLAAG